MTGHDGLHRRQMDKVAREIMEAVSNRREPGAPIRVGSYVLSGAQAEAYIANLRAEARRLSEALEKINRELATLGAHDG